VGIYVQSCYELRGAFIATSVILAHNHPSGALHPSVADVFSTKRIKKGLSYIDVTLWDHLIITENGYFSMADAKII
jgi:DNA repair protein RadC